MSTAEDYLQFAQMLVNGGTLNGKRYLGPKTVELIASNHTGEMVNGQFGRPAHGMGFGLGVQIVLDPVAADLRVSPGTFGWAGAYGTNQNMDPKEKMVSIIMMQGASGPLQRDFENAICAGDRGINEGYHEDTKTTKSHEVIWPTEYRALRRASCLRDVRAID